MKCAGCHKKFEANELDTDGFCYDCANYDPAPSVDLVTATVMAAGGVVARLKKRKGIDSSGTN